MFRRVGELLFLRPGAGGLHPKLGTKTVEGKLEPSCLRVLLLNSTLTTCLQSSRDFTPVCDALGACCHFLRARSCLRRDMGLFMGSHIRPGRCGGECPWVSGCSTCTLAFDTSTPWELLHQSVGNGIVADHADQATETAHPHSSIPPRPHRHIVTDQHRAAGQRTSVCIRIQRAFLIKTEI